MDLFITLLLLHRKKLLRTFLFSLIYLFNWPIGAEWPRLA